ncbi:restriction endonuclease [Saccharopolyspora sp. NFXS83]|uniref:restriction endonuclease n=1 Tax=Saccharopolyspora sp. NFXS83 TaxID=2993560 RepID=UPI00224A9F4D|nr:restriction endonuclease [Saccharopolyspora sp. NFXS83]MCX2729695.1 restriction endonuclease [Saccharopolyspora sp. NFXS83]
MAQQRSNNQRSEAWQQREAARIVREQEKRRKEAEREQKEAHIRRQQDLAADKTSTVERQLREIENVLADALRRPVPRPRFEDMKRSTTIPALDLGVDSKPLPPPRWEQFAPAPPGAISRLLGGRSRYEREKKVAETGFDAAQERHSEDEIARQRRVTDARRRHRAQQEAAGARATEHNKKIDELRKKFRQGDRHSVSSYYQQVIESIGDLKDFPTARRAGYVPESTLLAIEWRLPPISAIPTTKEYRYVKSKDTVEISKTRGIAEIRSIYRNLVSQIALRALRAVFEADSSELVTTVVLNGIVEEIDPATGHRVQPCLITLRATREHFNQVNLREVDPVQCVKKHFAADVSPHPEESVPVAPLLSFNMADPRIVDPIDVMSDIDQRPNLLDLSPKDFEHFIQNLFARMGFDTKIFKADGDGGVDCVAYDPTPIRGGKYVIQVKLYTKTVPPTAVRDLYGVVQHEGATKGILITTSGFGPSSYEFANGKPIQLYDGPNLLALCHEHDIPARILRTGKNRKDGP